MRSGDSYPGGQPGQPSANPGLRAGQPATVADSPGYPGGPATYLGAPASYPGGPVGYPAGPPPVRPPGPGGGGGGNGGGKRSWPTWVIVPFLGGALVVLGIFAILQVTVLSHGSAANPAASSTGPTVLMPAQMFPDALFKQLTTDIQDKNEKAFLSVAAPSARSAMQTWWENMQAIGYTTGLVMPTSKTDQVNLDSSGNGSTVVLAGTHNAFDPVNGNKLDDVPLERYQLTLHFSGPKAIGQITGWKPLGDDPWDQGKLYVRQDANVVVAGPADDSAVVDETLPIAQAAAAYDIGLINQVHSTDLRQTGFVVFVSGTPTVRSSWFSTTRQPSGWPPAANGYTAQLPGPGASADTTWSLGQLAGDDTGGARVVITPYQDQQDGSTRLETAELVHRFALDILAADYQSGFAGSAPYAPPSWAEEGFAVALEAAYYSDTNPAPTTYSFKALNDQLNELPASYKTGHLPTSAQLYSGSADAQQDWLVAAGSVYASIATKYGMNQLLASAFLMWTNDADPRSNVLESNTKGTYTFYGKDTIQSNWENYLSNPTDQAPLAGPNGI